MRFACDLFCLRILVRVLAHAPHPFCLRRSLPSDGCRAFLPVPSSNRVRVCLDVVCALRIAVRTVVHFCSPAATLDVHGARLLWYAHYRFAYAPRLAAACNACGDFRHFGAFRTVPSFCLPIPFFFTSSLVLLHPFFCLAILRSNCGRTGMLSSGG
jgi:hypothetical protein